MAISKFGAAAAALAAAGVIVGGGAALANAADSTSTSTSSTSAASGASGAAAANQGQAQQGARGGSPDTPVTGSEADKVIAAVKAKDSTVTITTVQKDPDGSFDAIGTKAGAPVAYDVSADLTTITERAGGMGGHRGPGGGSPDTPVTGTEAGKVTAAVKAKDSTVTITTVQKDPDGSYDAIGTKAGAPVAYDVSADLTTITERAGGMGGHGGPGAAQNGAQSDGQGGTAPTVPSTSATS